MFPWLEKRTVGSENATLHLVILGLSFTFGICQFSLKGPKPQIWPRKPDDLFGRDWTQDWFLSLALISFSFLFWGFILIFCLWVFACMYACVSGAIGEKKRVSIPPPPHAPEPGHRVVSSMWRLGLQPASPARATSCLSSPASFS